jgi:hypothetical protein
MPPAAQIPESPGAERFRGFVVDCRPSHAPAVLEASAAECDRRFRPCLAVARQKNAMPFPVAGTEKFRKVLSALGAEARIPDTSAIPSRLHPSGFTNTRHSAFDYSAAIEPERLR